MQKIANRVWLWINKDQRLLEILVILFMTQSIVILFPQAPVAPKNTHLFSRWLAEQHLSAEGWGKLLADLGFFSFRTSLWMRLSIMALILLICTQTVKLKEKWEQLSLIQRRIKGLFCVGGFIFVLGWGTQTLWGWTEAHIITWPTSTINLPDHAITLGSRSGRPRLWTEKYGLYLIPRGKTLGLEIQATTPQSQTLSLLPTVYSMAEEQLRVELTAQSPEAFFAVKEGDAIFRIARLDQTEDTPLQIQVYQQTSGELLHQSKLKTEGWVSTGDIHLHVQRYAVSVFDAVYNPGALPSLMGMLMIGGSVIAQMRMNKHSQQLIEQKTS